MEMQSGDEERLLTKRRREGERVEVETQDGGERRSTEAEGERTRRQRQEGRDQGKREEE